MTPTPFRKRDLPSAMSRGTRVPAKPNGESGHCLGIKPDEGKPGLLLTTVEVAELTECEGILARGLATFFEVGSALLRIRDNRLYRATHQTFSDYCRERWHIGRSYARRVIGAAERVSLLPSDTTLPRPSNEFQIRPFLKFPPAEFPDAWKRAVKIANNGKVTPGVLKTVIHELQPREARLSLARRPRPKRAKPPLGQVLTFLQEVRRRIEHHETDAALAALDRVEELLCGPE
jgi:hypothetical protein